MENFDIKPDGASPDIPRAGDPFAEEFAEEELIIAQHDSGSTPINSLQEGIRRFAAVLTEEECARQPQLAAAKRALKEQI